MLFAFAEIAVVSAKKVRLCDGTPGLGLPWPLELTEDPHGIPLLFRLALCWSDSSGALSGAALAEEFAVWIGTCCF